MNQATQQKMKQMRLLGMAQAFQTSMESRQAEKFTPDEWMSYLIEAEWEDRQQRKIQRYMTTARFRYPANVERIDFDHPRHLDRNYLLRLANGRFLDKKESIIITGSTGVGKSFSNCFGRNTSGSIRMAIIIRSFVTIYDCESSVIR